MTAYNFCSGFAALLLATIMAAQPVSAQDTDENGLYFRVGTGVVFNGSLDQGVSGPSIEVPTSLRTGFDTATTYGAALGFHYPAGTRTELEYRYSTAGITPATQSPATQSPVTQSTGATSMLALSADSDFKVHLLMSNFYKDFDNTSLFTPYVGFGVGGAFVTDGLGDQDAEFAYQGRAGVAIALGQGMSADIEFNYLRTTKLEFNTQISGGEEAVLSGAPYAVSAILIGIRKEF